MLWNLEDIVKAYKPLTKAEQLKQDTEFIMALPCGALFTDAEDIKELAKIIMRLPAGKMDAYKITYNSVDCICIKYDKSHVHTDQCHRGTYYRTCVPRREDWKIFYMRRCLASKQAYYFIINEGKFKPPGPEYFGYD